MISEERNQEESVSVVHVMLVCAICVTKRFVFIGYLWRGQALPSCHATSSQQLPPHSEHFLWRWDTTSHQEMWIELTTRQTHSWWRQLLQPCCYSAGPEIRLKINLEQANTEGTEQHPPLLGAETGCAKLHDINQKHHCERFQGRFWTNCRTYRTRQLGKLLEKASWG